MGATVSNVIALAARPDPASTTENGKVPPTRRPDTRPRKHLTPSEIAALLKAARHSGRYRLRDEIAVLLAYRHGLRASELVNLEWSQVDFDGARLHVRRAKKGTPATHPLRGDVLRALRKLRREAQNATFVFVSERGTPFSTSGFAKMVQRAGVEAGLGLKANPHMLRHACGFKLANDGKDTRSLQAYLGHKNIQHTVKYTATNPARFERLWR